jgi:hypothetical protein
MAERASQSDRHTGTCRPDKIQAGAQAPELAGDQPWLEREALFLAPRSVRRRAAATCPPAGEHQLASAAFSLSPFEHGTASTRDVCVRAARASYGELFPEDGQPRTGNVVRVPNGVRHRQIYCYQLLMEILPAAD